MYKFNAISQPLKIMLSSSPKVLTLIGTMVEHALVLHHLLITRSISMVRCLLMIPHKKSVSVVLGKNEF